MANHLWIPLSSSTSASCWNDLKLIFGASAALNCLFYFPSLSLFCHLCFASKSCESSIPCDSDQMTVWQPDEDPSVGSNPGPWMARPPPWTPHCLGRGCSVHGIEQTFLPARWERVAPRLTGIISWHHQLGSCGVKFLPQALTPW